MPSKQETEDKLLQAWKAWYDNPQDAEKASALYQASKPVMTRAISSYLGANAARDPLLVGRAKQVLYTSLSKYDPSKGPITSYIWTNMQRVQRISNLQQNVVRLSEKDALAAVELEKTFQRLTDELGREPTDEELADDMGISIKRIEKLRRRKFGFESSFEAIQEEGTGNLPGSVTLGVASQDATIAKTLYDSTEDKIDKFILERLYGLHGRKPETPTEIAKKLKMTKSAVSQRINKLTNSMLEIKQLLNVQT